MKSTGIIRRIDELGRVVIPKEIRRNLKIRDGENLEIIINDDMIILKKIQLLEDLSVYSKKIIDIFALFTKKRIIVTDREKIITSSFGIDNYILNNELVEIIDNRKIYISDKCEELFDVDSKFIIIPIINNIDSIGLVIIVDDEIKDSDIDIGKIIARLISEKLQ